MSRELAEPPPPSRYSYAAATKEVARELATRERGTQKQLAAGINLTEQQFSHRMRGASAKFSLEHFGAIADFLDMPDGWPFVGSGEAPKARPARRK